jgi:hypothetical protein
MPNPLVAIRSREVTDDALRVLQSGKSVLVRAHPGAGKTGGRSSGTIRLARALAWDGRRIALLVAQNDQLVETIRRLTSTWPDLPVYFAPSSTAWGRMPTWIRQAGSRPPNLRVVRDGNHRPALEAGAGLFVMTAAKFSFLWPAAETRPRSPRRTYVEPFQVVVIDEAWMAPAGLWLNLEPLTAQLALIGDPGQILPWAPSDDWYPGMLGSPIEALPEVALRELAGRIVELDLPVSRRLSSYTTPLVGSLPAYAATGTTAMFDGSEVPLGFRMTPFGDADVRRTLTTLADRGLALHRLPSDVAPQNDRLVASTCAAIAVGLVRAAPTLGHPDGQRDLTPSDVAIIVSHHDQRAAVRRALADLDSAIAAGIRIETANVIQGATVPVTVVWHPISGRADVSSFHADAGRLTVGLSRHTHGCVLVSRDGVRERIEATPSTSDQEGDAPDRRYEGLRAHALVWDYLAA